MLLSEIKNIKSEKRDLRNFGLVVGAILAVIGGIFFWFGRDSYPYFLVLGVFLIFLGLLWPKILLPLQKLWMIAAVMIGWLMTRVILGLLFYLAITPINLFSRLAGKKFLDVEIDRTRKSYWNYRTEQEKERSAYEKQF